jgi:hypothetical protein
MATSAKLESPTLRPESPYADISSRLTEEIRLGIINPVADSKRLGRNVTIEEATSMPIRPEDVGYAAAQVLWEYREEESSHISRVATDEDLETSRIEFEAKMDRIAGIIIDWYGATRRDAKFLTTVTLAVFDPDRTRGDEYLRKIEEVMNKEEE